MNCQQQYDLKQFFSESIKFAKQPLNWELSDWGKLGLSTAATFLVMQIDDDIRNELRQLNFNRKSMPIEFGRIWGEVYTTALIGSAFAISGFTSDNIQNKKIAFEIFQSAFYSGVIATVLKWALGRARPYTNKGDKSFNSFNKFDDDYWSMPSGHTCLAFSLSTVLSENTKSDLLKILCFVPAILTSYSRVAQDYHWTSDIILSASIGYFVGKWVTSNHQEDDIKLSYSGNQFGIIIPLK